jgi:hypothetical protein
MLQTCRYVRVRCCSNGIRTFIHSRSQPSKYTKSLECADGPASEPLKYDKTSNVVQSWGCCQPSLLLFVCFYVLRNDWILKYVEYNISNSIVPLIPWAFNGYLAGQWIPCFTQLEKPLPCSQVIGLFTAAFVMDVGIWETPVCDCYVHFRSWGEVRHVLSFCKIWGYYEGCCLLECDALESG